MEEDWPGLRDKYQCWYREDYSEAVAFLDEMIKQEGWEPHEIEECGPGRLAEKET